MPYARFASDRPPRVLIVDDDADTRSNLLDILELDGYAVETTGTLAAAVQAIRDHDDYFAILLDRRLPDGSAEAVLPKLKQLAPEAAVIIVTGYSDLEGAITAIREGAADYLLKPVNADALRTRLGGLAERRRSAEVIASLNKDLQQRVNELQTLLDVMPAGVAIARTLDCTSIRVNPALAHMLGCEPGEHPVFPVYRADRAVPSEEFPMRQAMALNQEVRDVELDLRRPEGQIVHVLSHAAPLCDEAGRPCGAVGVFIDITERKRAQERLLQTERLAAIGQMMAGLAHESRNALARSQSCLEMLAWEVEDRPAAIDLIQRTQKAQDHLKQLYEEVRGYAAPLKLERELWEVSAVWRQTWDNLALSRKGRDAVLEADDGGLDLCLPIDPFRLDQVFRNIFENSLAACPGPVRITIRCREAVLDDRPAVCVSVRDNGPGLTAEQRERIFDPFFTTKTKGTGLGMAIAKRIVEAHGGKIAVGGATSGEPTTGAEILIYLPRQVP